MLTHGAQLIVGKALLTPATGRHRRFLDFGDSPAAGTSPEAYVPGVQHPAGDRVFALIQLVYVPCLLFRHRSTPRLLLSSLPNRNLCVSWQLQGPLGGSCLIQV